MAIATEDQEGDLSGSFSTAGPEEDAMASYVGVDWGGSCWVVVKSGDTAAITTAPSFLNVWHNHGQHVDAILVDIPIGLPQSGTRACDRDASGYLKGRGSTVFSIPSRSVVEEDEYNQAREINGGKLGSQSWWLFPRIREVDVFLQEHPTASAKIYESHPEVCFRMLAEDLVASKTSENGLKHRLELLSGQNKLYERVKHCYEKRQEGAEWHDRISKGRLDDVLDAAVLAYTAAELNLDSRASEASYPAFPAEEAEIDTQLDLPMEIIHLGLE